MFSMPCRSNGDGDYEIIQDFASEHRRQRQWGAATALMGRILLARTWAGQGGGAAACRHGRKLAGRHGRKLAGTAASPCRLLPPALLMHAVAAAAAPPQLTTGCARSWPSRRRSLRRSATAWAT